ncbi:hypothetical protein QWZ13_11740 [Reinekea marina]|nr:hypothetical protein [Reinekea marina]MDN3649588.1 hypothetical protein [Reinekea marina]
MAPIFERGLFPPMCEKTHNKPKLLSPKTFAAQTGLGLNHATRDFAVV